jgi:hypothetical protein
MNETGVDTEYLCWLIPKLDFNTLFTFIITLLL